MSNDRQGATCAYPPFSSTLAQYKLTAEKRRTAAKMALKYAGNPAKSEFLLSAAALSVLARFQLLQVIEGLLRKRYRDF